MKLKLFLVIFLLCCISVSAEIYKGKFTYGGFDYETEVTIEDNKIKNIKIVKNKDDVYSRKAEAIINSIIKKQSTEVDAITGATASSMMLLASIKNALASKTYKIVCIGDSMTTYATQLEEIMKQQDIDISFNVVDKAIVGTNTAGLYSTLEDNIKEYNPNMVILMAGLNDRWYSIVDKWNSENIKNSRAHGLKKHKEILKKAIENNQADDWTYASLGEIYRLEGNFTNAEAKYKKALQINPNADWVWVKLGWLYRLTQDYNKLVEAYYKSIELNPSNDWAYIGLGEYYSFIGEYGKAEKAHKKALDINKNTSWAYAGLGECYLYKQEYDKAIEMFKRAIEIYPLYDLTYGNLAICYQKKGDYKLANEYFNKASQLRLEYYNHLTFANCREIEEYLVKKRIKLVVVQYPMRNIEPLKRIFNRKDDIIFVDNERIFKDVVRRNGYDKYFKNLFGGDFGHLTEDGNRLLAENIAKTILKEYFNRDIK